MGADVNAFIDKIIADAEKKVRTDLKDISSKIKRDFIARAKEVVLLYYSNYTPKIYTRTNNLQDNVIDDSISFSTLNGNSYGSWIQFNSHGMSEYSMGNKDVVVSNFMYGVHGRSNVYVENTPAMDLMDEFQENYKRTLDVYFKNLGYIVK